MTLTTEQKWLRRREMAELTGQGTPGRPPKGYEKEKPPKAKKLSFSDDAIERRRRRSVDDTDEPNEKISLSSKDVYLLGKGVSVQWLSRVFRISRHNVEKKIRPCHPIGVGDYGNPLYDLPQAASYLVDPKIDMKEYLKNVKEDDLPEKLRESIWNSKLKKQRWEEKAGHLWRTEYVIDRMGEVLANARQSVQQIPDRVERIAGLSIEQYKIVRNATEEVLNQIYEDMLAMQQSSATYNQLNDEGISDEPDRPEREDLA